MPNSKTKPRGGVAAPSAGSECPVVIAAGLHSIIADLGLALVTLKQEGGGCPATKLVINRAITTAHEILGTQNAPAMPTASDGRPNT